ncbi:S49 family peptidase [Escherichia coli]
MPVPIVFTRNSLFDIVNTIRQAKDDRNITGIVMDLKNFAGGDQPSMQYIGKALKEFRDSGKRVLPLGENCSQGQYYLASFANKIWLSPQGVVRSARLCHQRSVLQIVAG